MQKTFPASCCFPNRPASQVAATLANTILRLLRYTFFTDQTLNPR
ncbi:MAG TPA: hypothetical protein V6D11_07130 [Waterburya sp.]